ncbi:hypothetical protein NEOC65_001739 [Neochlamydia sp. AcF65]|nr:hypothetical protein [Neochlamydia sp. AcF65]MBS4171118.1 hypothetical protein [Neochlamydia sp. AcF95]
MRRKVICKNLIIHSQATSQATSYVISCFIKLLSLNKEAIFKGLGMQTWFFQSVLFS